MSSRGARIAALAAAFTVLAPLGYSASAAEPQLKIDTSKKTYIVQLDAAPLASYAGGKAGIPATKPAPGEKVQPKSANGRAYEAHLKNEQRKTLRAAGLKETAKKHDYTVAFNGFAAELTSAEAAKLQKAPGVVKVWEDEIRHADTVSTPDYLGMTGKDGVWKTQFGGDINAGKGIVVGVIDTGIDPNNPSFAALSRSKMPKGNFECETENDRAFRCSTKIVGARWYGVEHGNDVAYDHKSPRDTNGHGSHTAGTAAGNHGVSMSVLGQDMGLGSGMAPAAHVAVYKALWQTADGNGSGTTAGLVAAIDDAVADGVDVINYSVSGSSTSVVGPDEIAFLFAADAGVFVSTSAGNSGDSVGVSSVAHNAPWTMTVAASTHDRGAENTLTLGNGSKYQGVGYGGPLAPTSLVLAADIAAAGATKPELCGTGSLDDAKAAGKLIICDRGEHALVDKAAEVKASGGAGMVLVNVPGGASNQNAIIYGLPATHLTAADGTAVKTYAAGNTAATGAISETTTVKVNAPSMASFSSYGPARAGGGDLLKPDITAPGADVLAAVAGGPKGEAQYDLLSGTSMSAPHIAGLGALLKQKNPNWSPAAVKSAMMTTARQTDDAGKPIMRGTAVATPLNYGAGEVQPLESYSPGLVYDAGWNDWLAYACGIGQLAAPCPETPVDPSDLNYPSIALGDLAGKQTVTRTVTNVGQGPMTYTAKVEAPAGTTVTVSPTTIKVPAKGKTTFRVTITRTSAALGQYTFGALTWEPTSKKVQPVRSPIAVRPVALAAPGEVLGSGIEGSTVLPVTPGFTGTLNTDVDGLLASNTQDVTVENAEDTQTVFSVAVGTKVLRLASYAAEVEADDIDLYLFHCGPSCVQVGQSGAGGSDEMITLKNPASTGVYVLLTDLWSNEPSVTYPLHMWQLGDAAAGNLTVNPTSVSVTQGTPTTVTASWTGLEASKRYLGQVNFLEGSNVAGSTLVTVTP